MAGLAIISGANAGRYFRLAGRPLAVGRDPARDIQLIDPKVSRKHFLIRRREGAWVLLPFRSVNGVLVNGREVEEEVVLCDGDEIVAGDTTLRFTTSDDPDRTDGLERRKLAERPLREDQTMRNRPPQR